MTQVMVMAAFDAVNEQATRIAWRHAAYQRMKDMPKSEDKATGFQTHTAKKQSLRDQYAMAQFATKMMGKG